MHASPVDPRDTRWEDVTPTYRVYFWSRLDWPEAVPAEIRGWLSDEWRLTDVTDVHVALTWARDTSHGRSYTLHVEANGGHGRGLIKLAGEDPADGV